MTHAEAFTTLAAVSCCCFNQPQEGQSATPHHVLAKAWALGLVGLGPCAVSRVQHPRASRFLLQCEMTANPFRCKICLARLEMKRSAPSPPVVDGRMESPFRTREGKAEGHHEPSLGRCEVSRGAEGGSLGFRPSAGARTQAGCWWLCPQGCQTD